jgi:predicted phage-related endonuclease
VNDQDYSTFAPLGSAAARVLDRVEAGRAPAGITRLPISDRASWLKMREADVTASAAAALFGDGVHPYQTAYGLWALKSGLVQEDQAESPAMRRGRLLEPIALQLLREEQPTWAIVAGDSYYRDAQHRIGATPDAFATRPDIEGRGVVQVKTVGNFAFKKGWRGEDGEVEVPLWIAVQASVEAALTGATWACVAAMALGDGGLDLHLVDIPLRPALIARFRTLAGEFWCRVADKDPFPPDYNRDAGLIARLCDPDDDVEVDLSGDNEIGELLEKRAAHSLAERDGRAASDLRKEIDARLTVKLGNAARGRVADGRVIEIKVVKKRAYEVKASQHTQLKVKEKAA